MIRMVRAGALVVVGFVLGVFGIAWYSGTSIADIRAGKLASSCLPDNARADNEESFFVSCGGIF